VHRFIRRRILLPAFETGFKRRKTLRYWEDLERSQWFSRARVEEMQFQSLRRLLAHANEHCPYYRDAWTALGLNPQTLRSLEDLRRWPVIDRDVIGTYRLRMRAQIPGMRLIAKSSGGSAGVPLHFDLDTDSHDRRAAAWHRGYSWAGAEPGTRQYYLWAVAFNRPLWRQWKDDLYNWFYGRLVVNSFELSEDRVAEFLEVLNRYQPEVIVAYTNPLYTFAKSIEEQKLQPVSPKSIITGAEKLYPFQRTLIERVFRAPVFETYGSREVMLIGAECDRHEGLHLTAEHLLVEILDDEGHPTPEGQEGNVVITDLFNYGMPFIRYANGDRAVAGYAMCSCGRGLPLLRNLIGRRLDLLQSPDGRRIPGEFFPHLMKDFPAVRRFQVVQEKPDRIQLRLVLKDGWSPADQAILDQEIRKVIGPELALDIVPVADIPLTPAGKLRVVVNLCSTRPEAQPAGNGPPRR
jgi:phenylacetate-CoA ligase